VVLPPQLRRWPPPYTGKVLKEKADSWHHGVSPPSHQAWLDLLLAALKHLADRGLTAGCVLTNLHHRRIVPLMERRLRIFEMDESANPIALAESRLLLDLFSREYAATRARRAIDLRAGRSDDTALWAFAMLPVGQLVSKFFLFPFLFCWFLGRRRVLRLRLIPTDGARERRAVRPTHAPVSCARARGATARTGVGGAQERAERAAAGAPGAEEQGVPAARAAGTFLARDRGVLIVRRGREGRRRGRR
jgi:hypothetical protein